MGAELELLALQPYQLRVTQTTLCVVCRGAILAGDALISHVAEAGAGPSITVPVLLSQTVVHAIVHRPNHPRAYFCILGFRGRVVNIQQLLDITRAGWITGAWGFLVGRTDGC